MKYVLRVLAFVVALPIAMLAALVIFLHGCKDGTLVCDPVHPSTRPATGPGGGPGTSPGTKPAETEPATRPEPPVCDPVHLPPPPEEK